MVLVTFLAPAAGLIAAGLAVPSLLLLYLLKLRRTPVRVGSTMLWQRAVDDLEVNEPFRWLRLSLLFFAQLLALLLLCAALARPAIGGLDTSADRAVLLIDRSASMNAADVPGGGTRLDAAIGDARGRLDDLLDAGTSVMVIDFAAEPRVLANMTTDRGALRRALDSITPTDQPGDIERAFRTIGALNAGSEDTSLHTILFSDGGFGTSESLVLPSSTVEFIPAGPENPGPNTGIVALGARRDASNPSLVRIFARIQTNDPQTQGLPVRLGRDGEPADRAYARFEQSQSQDPNREGTPYRAEASVSFELNWPRGALLTLELVSDDAYAGDNSASITIGETRPPRIELVQPDEPGPEAWVVRDLLDAITDGTLRTRTESEAPLEADVSIYDRVSPAELPTRDSLVLGGTLPIPQIRAEPITTRPATILSWDRSHPLLADVSLDGILIDRWIPTRINQDGQGEANSGGTTEDEDSVQNSRYEVRRLASGPAGAMIVEARSVLGHRLVSVAFAPSDSSWALDFGFAVFMGNAVEWLSRAGGSDSARWFSTAEPVTVRVPGSASVARFEGPIVREANVNPGSGQASLGLLDRAGVYIGPTGSVAPLNLLDGTETSLLSSQELTISGRSVTGGRAGGEPSEVWEWFVLGALALMTLEWFWFGWRMRV